MANMMHEILEELDRTDGLLKKSLKEINDKGALDQTSLKLLGDVLDGIKDSCEIHEKTEQPEYSSGSYGMWDARGAYGYPDNYSGRRYDDGRYAPDRRSRDDRSYEANSYDNYGNSRGKDPMIEELERQMQEAKTEQEREVIRKMIMERERKFH